MSEPPEHSDHPPAAPSARARRFPRQLGLAAPLVVLLVALSWTGVLDRRPAEYVDRAIVQATVAFATARALNAGISVLQSLEVSPPVVGGATLGIGQVLDPLNDLVEQYSSLMKWAIGSLVIQKLLLEIVSDRIFNLMLTAAALLWLAALFWPGAGLTMPAGRMFALLVLLRFALVAVVGLNGLVDHVFIEPRAAADLQRLDRLANEVPAASELEAAPDSWASRLRDAAGQYSPARLKQRLEHAVANVLNLMAVFALRTMILPLLFLWGLVRGAGWILGRPLRFPDPEV